jgi:hypothetical protein
LAQLETSGLAVAMRQWLWLYPIVEIVHILGFVVLVGAAFSFDLRLLGAARALPVARMERHLLRSARWSLLLIVPTGLAMFAAHATEMAENPAFRLKLVLLVAAGLNAAIFRRGPFRSVRDWNSDAPAPGLARLAGVLSILLWTGIIACGRLLAYL